MNKGINNIGSIKRTKKVKLIHVVDDAVGIKRRRSKKGFDYFDVNGKTISNTETLIRIKSLSIPPAWENVWISPIENSHLQATGFDSKGRKQYKYHPHWNDIRSQSKYDRMIEFGEKLPLIRRRIKKDLKKRGLPKEKVLAILVSLLNRTFLRIGNVEYEKANKTFGLSTLRNKHVKIKSDEIEFKFTAKSGKQSIINLKDKLLASLVKKCRDLPGYHLFSYVNDDGETKEIGSYDVNQYLKEISGEDFTSKDFRTWAGTVSALNYLLRTSLKDGERNNSIIINCIKSVAQVLKNTVNICKKYYIHPKIWEIYNNGNFEKLLIQKLPRNSGLSREEKLVLQMLKTD